MEQKKAQTKKLHWNITLPTAILSSTQAPTAPPTNIIRSRSVSFVPAPNPSVLPKPSVLPSETSLETVPSNESEPSGISSALNESLAECYESLDDAGRQSLMFSAMTSKDYSLLQSLLQLQKAKGIFTLPKLSGKLLEQANKQKLPILAYDKDASKRRYYWNTWFMKLQIIVGLFSTTSKFIDKNGTISLFDEKQSNVANGAVFILVQSYVDKYYADQLHSTYNGKGDQALLYLQRSCTKQTNQNKHHFHQAFTSLTILTSESATSFLRRFNIARADAEKVIPNLQPKLMLLNLIKYYRILLFVRYTSSSFFYFFLLDHHSYEQPECQKRGLCFCKFLSFYNINKWNICGW